MRVWKKFFFHFWPDILLYTIYFQQWRKSTIFSMVLLVFCCQQWSYFFQFWYSTNPLQINSYYTLNSVSLFWLVESVQWLFEISTCDIITADYTTIMSRTLKVTCNHVIYDCGAWFLRVIMSSSNRFVLLAVCFIQCNNKAINRFSFCDIQDNQGLCKGYQPKPKAESNSPYLDYLDYPVYHKRFIQ